MALIIQLMILLVMVVIGVRSALQHYQNSNILVLGAGVAAAKVLHDLSFPSNSSQYNVLGFVSSHVNEASIPPKLRYNSERNLLGLSKRLKAGTVVVATDQRVNHEWVQQLLDCKLNGIKVIAASALIIHQEENASVSEGALRTPGHY